MFKHLLVLLTFLAIVAGDGFRTNFQYKGNMKHPDLPDHCYVPEYDLTIPINKSLYPTNLNKTCIKVFCREDFVLKTTSCQAPSDDIHCKIGQYDYTKPFPSCCRTWKCGDTEFSTKDYEDKY